MREVVRASGVTSRTLRHYDAIGLLRPTSVGAGGERRYDDAALVRLQRILVLRGLGLRLDAIAEVLGDTVDQAAALREHAAQLRDERDRVEQRIAAVEHTLAALEKGREPDMEQMFAGFDQEKYTAEVAERWGREKAEASSAWWNGMSEAERGEFTAHLARLNEDWAEAARSGVPADSPEALALAARHVSWLRSVPFAPGATGDEDAARRYVLGLADMYVADPRFAANYGGAEGAEFVRAALRAHYGLQG